MSDDNFVTYKLGLVKRSANQTMRVGIKDNERDHIDSTISMHKVNSGQPQCSVISDKVYQ